MTAPAVLGEAERDAFATLVAELSREFGNRADPETIRDVARTSLDAFTDAKVKDFVPLLASRAARAHLRTIGRRIP
jgi:hypothetical protein